MTDRHFVKYTFLQVDPAWKRLDAEQRAQDKAEFLAACEAFGEDHLVQAFSLVGIRGDADMIVSVEVENLDRIHEFGVILAQSGLMKWCTQPYALLGMRKGSEYSDEQRLVPRPFRGKYVFIYPFVKRRDWYALAAEERWRVMQDHIRVGKEYPMVDNHTIVLLRPRRPGVRRRVRHRRRRRVHGSRPPAAPDRGLGLHRARHAELHLHPHLGRAGARARSTASPSRVPGDVGQA